MESKGKGRGSHILNTSIGSRACKSAVIIPHKVIKVGCHYFPLGQRLPSQPNSITALWPVPNYTAWWQRYMCVNNLLRVITWKCNCQESNPRPRDCESNALTISITLSCHTWKVHSVKRVFFKYMLYKFSSFVFIVQILVLPVFVTNHH